MWDRKELKARGKAAFKANYWKCVLVALLLVVLVSGSAFSTSRTTTNQIEDASGTTQAPASVDTDTVDVQFENGIFTVNGQTYDNAQDAITAIGEAANAKPEDIEKAKELVNAIEANPEEAKAAVLMLGAAVIGVVLIVLLVTSLVRIFVTNPIEVGCQNFFVRNSDAPAELGEIKRGFHPYWRNVGAMLLRGLFLFLWTLLLIVPGIIKAYSYRMVPYILADDPTISGMDAITLSRRMMDGQKWNAFVLDLSFIGWFLLSAVTLGLVGIFYTNPYVYATHAELYQTLKAQMN
jgi:uncharacterized membrane protein